MTIVAWSFMSSVSRGLLPTALPLGAWSKRYLGRGAAPPARLGIWIGRGARGRWFDLLRPGRRVDRRSARHRADHPRSWRSRAPDVPRGRAERGAGTGEGPEAATAAFYRWRAAASASPLAAPAGLRTGPAGSGGTPLLAQARLGVATHADHRCSSTAGAS